MKEEIREIIDYYSKQRNPQEQENIVAMLREIQEAEGCITMKVQEEAAEALGVKPSVLSCIIKRYPSLKEVDYAHEMVLCTGKAVNAKQYGNFRYGKERIWHFKRRYISRRKLSSDYKKLFKAMQNFSQYAFGRRVVCQFNKRKGNIIIRKKEIKHWNIRYYYLI